MYYVGELCEIAREGLHGFAIGTPVIVKEVIEDPRAYKVDSDDNGRKRSRYVEEGDLRGYDNLKPAA